MTTPTFSRPNVFDKARIPSGGKSEFWMRKMFPSNWDVALEELFPKVEYKKWAEREAQPHDRDRFGCTPLHISSEIGSSAHGGRLVSDSGVDIDATAMLDLQPLHLASWHGNIGSLLVLLKAGASRSGKDAAGWTPLHYAAAHGHLGCVRLLIQGEAPVHEVDFLGNSALHYACEYDRADIVDHLLAAGADCKLENRLGESAYDMAAQVKADTTLTRLREWLSGGERQRTQRLNHKIDESLANALSEVKQSGVDVNSILSLGKR